MHSVMEVASLFQQVLPDVLLSKWTIDSREVNEGDVFVALPGNHVDGASFIDDALAKGAALVIASCQHASDRVLSVANPQEALAKIAKFSLQLHPVQKTIAITGTVGKTTVKEMIKHVLSQQFCVHATYGNQNNELGVPLTILNRPKDCQYLILEMGAAKPHDIDYLMEIAAPDVGVCTAISSAHTANYESIYQLVNTKKAIYSRLKQPGFAVICEDEEYATDFKSSTQAKQILCSQKNQNAPLYVSHQYRASGLNLKINHQGVAQSLNLNLLGAHFVKHSMLVAGLLLACGLDLDLLQSLEHMQPIPGRMYPIQLADCLLIDDTYNASPAAVRAAIDYLSGFDHSMLILGDMGELGEESASHHQNIGFYANGKIDTLWTLGQSTRLTCASFSGNKIHFTEKDELIANLSQLQKPKVLLVKGSRFMQMEVIVQSLTHTKEKQC